jgi:4'-phosphopantetheinyl transferase
MKYLISNINDYKKEYIDSFYNRINKDKRNKIDKYINVIDRNRSIIGEILLSKLIDNYDELDIYTNKYGKPYISNKNIFFNISHSNDYVVCVISDKEIGIDIEKIRDVDINVIKRFATSIEKKYIGNNINKLWEIFTLKEAYWKCMGKNLDKLLDVEFNINKKSIICSDNTINSFFIKDIDGYIISIVEKKT